jgi:hypothetical protein
VELAKDVQQQRDRHGGFVEKQGRADVREIARPL